MTIKELQKIDFRYVRIIADGAQKRYINTNFDELLEYIGNHFPVNNRTPIGSAYVRIRKETDKLLQVSWSHNWKLKTSKREISSIRRSNYWILDGQGGNYYLRIPYKIGFIFTAIINIVNEIKKSETIPDSLNNCIGSAYGCSFYNYHIEEYDRVYRMYLRINAQQFNFGNNPAKLYDVFHAPNNVFDRIFS